MDFLAVSELLMRLLPAAVQAAATVQADTGKSWEQVTEDVIAHLTAGQPNAPALSPEAGK